MTWDSWVWYTISPCIKWGDAWFYWGTVLIGCIGSVRIDVHVRLPYCEGQSICTQRSDPHPMCLILWMLSVFTSPNLGNITNQSVPNLVDLKSSIQTCDWSQGLPWALCSWPFFHIRRDDTNLLVLLCYHGRDTAFNGFFKPEPTVNIRKIPRSSFGSAICDHILFVHAVFGCNTTTSCGMVQASM